MNNTKISALLTLVIALVCTAVHAEVLTIEQNGNPVPTIGKAAAGCTPATGATELDINNTRALIQTGGDMWWDLQGQPNYEIPKGSGKTSLFAGSLWLGGKDVSGQLKVAAQRFRSQGIDFWTGPLSKTNAEIDPGRCLEFDKHFVSTRAEVALFKAWFDAGVADIEAGTNTQSTNFPDYTIPDFILDWPAHGDESRNEDPFLAPFIDRDGDGVYDPINDGDYPGYDLEGELDCNAGKIVNIFGDQNLWWVFNDKGNIHTETGAQSIGLEIRAQAFAFASNDEVNNMTFYNYELVNRSTFTLTETYFGQWVDADLGRAQDDFVGCDVQRGLGYCYNGDEDDEGPRGYGAQPPAIGVDFFQGPFQDQDGLDNPLTQDYNRAVADGGIPYKGIGIGYGDGIVDNERFGMRKFLYHNNAGLAPNSDPRTGVEYYNYLSGFWRDGIRMIYGGDARPGSPGALDDVEADYMFPGDSDPIGWGTGGNPQASWTEEDVTNNNPGDRRFLQSAGPFTLLPGAVNNITVGVVWARAESGGAFGSVEAVRKADDKTQALFDNCFKVLDGPDAPDVAYQEGDKELILFLSNSSISNNHKEEYQEESPFLLAPDTTEDGRTLTTSEKSAYATYTFQGYQIFQVKDNTVSIDDCIGLGADPDKCRLAAQADLKDEVDNLINYYFDAETAGNIPVLEVEGANTGIQHAFRFTEDLFAEGNNALVNHKTYYYIAIAYAHNSFGDTIQGIDGTYDPNDPNRLDGQKTPYIASRKAALGPISRVSCIPHPPSVENNGTVTNANFGDGVQLTRIEGTGNGGNEVHLTDATIDQIMSGAPWKVANATYEQGQGPIDIRVIDPLSVPADSFTIAIKDSITPGDLTDAYWMMWNSTDTVFSESTLSKKTEQIITSWGLAVNIEQIPLTLDSVSNENSFISASAEFDNPDSLWLFGIRDIDGETAFNWIRSGTNNENTDATIDENDDYFYTENTNTGLSPKYFIDESQVYEGLTNGLGGEWAPYRLSSNENHGPMITSISLENLFAPARQLDQVGNAAFEGHDAMDFLQSVDIVLTNDQSKWTRCPVVEMQDVASLAEGGVAKGGLRSAPSLDKNGNATFIGAGASSDPNAANYISDQGMGWFPGYAINVETGERLNMAFGEDSYLITENGRDMLWNPTTEVVDGVTGTDIRFGGKHYIFVFRNNIVEEGIQFQNTNNISAALELTNEDFRMPSYDAGAFAVDMLKQNTTNLSAIQNTSTVRAVWRSCMWVGLPLALTGRTLLNTVATIKLRVKTPYAQHMPNTNALNSVDLLTIGQRYFANAGPFKLGSDTLRRGDVFTASSLNMVPINDLTGTVNILKQGLDNNNLAIPVVNDALPMYGFRTDDIAVKTSVAATAKTALDLVNVVPNPYYAYSSYESDRLDNRVKITNLPESCTVSIYSVSGQLVRRIEKDDPTITSVDWDLENEANIPVSSGVYIIHIGAPGIGEKTIKWFGVMRAVDLDSF